MNDESFSILTSIPRLERKRPDHLHLLLVSDIHADLVSICRLAQICGTKGYRFDRVICGGDLSNLAPVEFRNRDREACLRADADASAVINELQNIDPRVFFVPGNHDSPCIFEEDPQQFYSNVSLSSTNMHLACHPLADTLYIAGLGGCVPGYRESDGLEIWDGTPYDNESRIEADLEALEQAIRSARNNRVGNPELGSEDHDEFQYILLTHCGPKSSETSVDRNFVFPDVINAGSSSIDRYLCTNGYDSAKEGHCRILCNIHGHVHDGSRFENHESGILVINPGSLRDGNFIRLELIRVDNTWKVHQVHVDSLRETLSEETIIDDS